MNNQYAANARAFAEESRPTSFAAVAARMLTLCAAGVIGTALLAAVSHLA